MPPFPPPRGPGNVLGFTPAKLKANTSLRSFPGLRARQDAAAERSQGSGVTAHGCLGSTMQITSLTSSRATELPCAPSEPFLDEFLQLSDPGGFLLGRGSAQRERAGAVPAGGRSGEAQAEKVQHAALLTPLQALREQSTALTDLGAAAAEPVSNLHLLFTHPGLWMTPSSAPAAEQV